MSDERERPDGVPPADEGIGLPTPPSPCRLPPFDLPPASEGDATGPDNGALDAPQGEGRP